MKVTLREARSFGGVFALVGSGSWLRHREAKEAHTADALFDRACERLVVCGWNCRPKANFWLSIKPLAYETSERVRRLYQRGPAYGGEDFAADHRAEDGGQ